MKICVSATGPSLNAEVSLHFARSPYFLIVDVDTGECEVLENSPEMTVAGGGAIARIARAYDAAAVLAGEYGPNAQEILRESGVSLIANVKGVIEEVVAGYATRMEDDTP